MAILLSGRGTNMLALAQRCAQGDLEAKICFVASDKKDAYGIKMAKSMGLKTLLLPYEEGKGQAEKVLDEKVQSDSVDWI
ncbi:MAG TPA: formyltransferase family protein, partial [Acetomicrobium sp.]|nr:formyltransferase family protein [Acetomicrobium sp.]